MEIWRAWDEPQPLPRSVGSVLTAPATATTSRVCPLLDATPILPPSSGPLNPAGRVGNQPNPPRCASNSNPFPHPLLLPALPVLPPIHPPSPAIGFSQHHYHTRHSSHSNTKYETQPLTPIHSATSPRAAFTVPTTVYHKSTPDRSSSHSPHGSQPLSRPRR